MERHVAAAKTTSGTKTRRLPSVRAQQKRLKHQFEALLLALEGGVEASDYAQVEKRAKAFMAVLKAQKEVYHTAPARGEVQMNDEDYEGLDQKSQGKRTEAERLDYWRGVLERKLDRLAAARTKKGLDPQPTD